MRVGYRVSVKRVLAATAATLAVVLSAMAALPPATVAADTAACSEALPTNRHMGVGIFNSSPDGASANIEHQVLNKCSPPGGFEVDGTFAYVNIQGPNGWDIVQVGQGDCRAPGACQVGGMRTYFGYGRDHNSPGCAAYTSVPPILPTVVWLAGIHKIHHTANTWRLSVGGNLLMTIPEASVCWTPNAATWFGESLDWGDAIGGTATNKLNIFQMMHTQTEGGSFSYTSFNPSANCNVDDTSTPPFFCDIYGASSVSLWTAR